MGDHVAAKQPEQKRHHDRHSRKSEFCVGQPVLARNLWEPGEIVNRTGPVVYKVNVNGQVQWPMM